MKVRPPSVTRSPWPRVDSRTSPTWRSGFRRGTRTRPWVIDTYLAATEKLAGQAEELHAAAKRAAHALRQLAAREGRS